MNLTSTLIKYIKLSWLMTKHNLLSAMEYRFSFFSKIIGMGINDVGIILVWVIFFNHFKNINGWKLEDTILLFALGTINFGLLRVFAGGIEELARTINRGELDYYLALPKNVLWHASSSRLDVSAIGDIIFGLILFGFFTHPTFYSSIVFFVVIIISSMIIYNFLVVVHTIGFFVPNFEETSDRILHALLGVTFYPENTFSGALKAIMYTVLPAFFVAWLPVSLVKHIRWDLLGGMILVWILSSIFAFWFFNKGLKHYESGNLINVKM